MSEPSQEFLRRGLVFGWLGDLGFSVSCVKKLIANGTIVAETLKQRVKDEGGRMNGSEKKKGKKKAGGMPGPRCYFRKSQIKKELGL